MTEKILDVSGFKIAYTDVGPEDGRVIFCVHGLLSNGRDYDALGAVLAAQGYRVIAIDLPGRGRSDTFHDSSFYVLPNYIPSCLALLKSVTGGKEFDWLGVSLGGMIGMVVAGMKAIKMGRLIVVDIGPEVPGSALDIVASYAKAPSVFKTKEDAVTFLKFRCASWGITKPETWDHLIAHNIVQTPEGYTMHYDPGIGEALKDKNETVAFWPVWKKIKQSLLLIRGGKSVILPLEIAVKMQKIYKGPDMQTITFDDCGHVPNLMEAGQIAKLIDWLSKARGESKKKDGMSRLKAWIKEGPFKLRILPYFIIYLLSFRLLGLNLWSDIVLSGVGFIFAFWGVSFIQTVFWRYARGHEGRTPFRQMAFFVCALLLVFVQIPILMLFCMLPFFPFVKG